MSKTISIADVDAQQLFYDVSRTQEEVVILTDKGEPIATVAPFGISLEERRRKALEELRKKYPIRILGDIVEPLGEWEMSE